MGLGAHPSCRGLGRMGCIEARFSFSPLPADSADGLRPWTEDTPQGAMHGEDVRDEFFGFPNGLWIRRRLLSSTSNPIEIFAETGKRRVNAATMRAFIFLAILLSSLAACNLKPDPPSIGSATMSADRTITLQLRAEDGRGSVGDGTLVYKPGSRDYEEVLDHVGGLRPGETKPVPPWP